MRVAVGRVGAGRYERESCISAQLRNEYIEARVGMEEDIVVNNHHKLGPRVRDQRVAPGRQPLGATNSVAAAAVQEGLVGAIQVRVRPLDRDQDRKR